MANNLNGIHLPEGLVWVDEFQTTQVAQSVNRSLTGAFIVQTSVKQAGRPMTLDGPDSAWVSRTQLDALRTLIEDNPDTEFVLNYRDTDYTVIQNSTSGPALVATPIIDYESPDGEAWYSIKLNLYIL